VTNLEYLQSQGGGLLPYGIWMRTDPNIEASKLVQGITRQSKVIPERVVNLRQILAKDAGRLERVGVFGMLSICFLAGTVLAVFGLLVHNAASLRRRSLRFAVLQALGLARINVLLTVFTEYLGVMLYSIITGVALGIVGAYIYVPYFQLTDEAKVPVPPYLPMIDQQRAGIIALVMGLALVAVEAMVLWRLLRIRLFETLRLGTRE
jgi:putative ABC transport system permease protein